MALCENVKERDGLEGTETETIIVKFVERERGRERGREREN